MLSEIERLQLHASDPEYSVYVSASAGSGKTKVLVDRVLRLLLIGTPITNIVCVTFTNSAAEEMVERLKHKARYWFFCDHNSLYQSISFLIGYAAPEQMLGIAKTLYAVLIQNSAKIKIQTIHSLCVDILKIDTMQHVDKKNIQIIPSADQQRFLRAAYYKSVERAELQSDLKLLCSIYTHHTLFERITDLVRQYGKFSEYLRKYNKVQELADDVFASFNMPYHEDYELYMLSLIKHINFTPIRLIALKLSANGNKTGQALLKWLEQDTKIQLGKIDFYAAIFLTQEHQKRVRIDGFKLLNEQERAELLIHQQEIFCMMQSIRSFKAAAINLAFIRCSKSVFDLYNLMKDEKHFVEYDELLLKAIDALSVSDQRHWLLWNLDCNIDHLLVDEAQDLNRYQWQIINLLTEEFFVGASAKAINRTVFIVGDYKQSIFGFQGAEPAIFQEICQYYSSKCKHAMKKWSEISFNVSFRSGTKILKIVDAIFTTVPVFAQYAPHISQRNSLSHFELCPLFDDACEDAMQDEQWELPTKGEKKVSKNEKLADFICNKIAAWLRDNKMICGKDRTIEPRDVMIIFRKRGKIFEAISTKLRELNIDFVSSAPVDLKEQLVILDIIAVVQFVLNPHDNFNLVNLLKSPLFSFSESDIFQLISSKKRENDVFSEISANPTFCAVNQKLQDIIQQFYTHNEYHFLYWIVFQYMHCYNGADRFLVQTACNAFLQVFLQFSELYPCHSIRAFVQWFELADNLALKIDNAMDSNAVQLLTAHASKGLQSPVVILADASESENLLTDNVMWSQDFPFLSTGIRYDDATLKGIKEEKKVLNKHDNMKLLYVAMTRAEDELYVCGMNNNKKANWYELLAEISSNEDCDI